jgi:flagellar hook-length control protein FliK
LARGVGRENAVDTAGARTVATDDAPAADPHEEERSVGWSESAGGSSLHGSAAAANRQQTPPGAGKLAPEAQIASASKLAPTPDATAGTDLPVSASSGTALPSQGVYAAPVQVERLDVINPAQFAATATNPSAASTSPNEQIAFQIAHAVHEGNDRLVVQLRPHSLGRIRIELEVGPDNRVIAVIGVERQETLDLMQRDARGLERALNDAGLKADTGSLSFNLRSDGDHRGNGNTDGVSRPLTVADIEEAPAPPPQIYRVYGRAMADGVDIRV